MTTPVSPIDPLGVRPTINLAAVLVAAVAAVLLVRELKRKP